MPPKKAVRRKAKSQSVIDDEEFDDLLEEQERQHAEKGDVDVLAITNGKVSKPKASENNSTQQDTSFAEEEAAVIQKRKYTKKAQDPEEICDTYITNFKRKHDLKLNNYFKSLNESIQSGFTGLANEMGNLAKYLKYNSAVGQKKAINNGQSESPVECSPAKKSRLSNGTFVNGSSEYAAYNNRPFSDDQSSRSSSVSSKFQNDMARSQYSSRFGNQRYFDQNEDNFRRYQAYVAEHEQYSYDAFQYDGNSRYTRGDDNR